MTKVTVTQLDCSKNERDVEKNHGPATVILRWKKDPFVDLPFAHCDECKAVALRLGAEIINEIN